jgi:transposase
MMMEGSALLPLPQGFQITSIERQETSLLIRVLSTLPTGICPLCGQVSDAIHSRYQRRLKDLPCAGTPVALILSVRKFFCHNQHCSRKIFAERLPALALPSAQMTIRFSEALAVIGLCTSGSLGTRLGSRLGITTSWMTILRRIMQLPEVESSPVTALGVDDFSFKRGRRFGTILVNLSTHQVIDLLAERSADSAAAWLRTHPEIEYVSRDRGQDYAQAASEGAPQAVQIADRFHLMKNFVEAIEAEVARCYKQLHHAQSPLPSPDMLTPDQWKDVPDGDGQQKCAEKKIGKQEQFEQVKALLSQGVSALEVAGRLAIPVRRVYHWKAREDYPAGVVERTQRTDKQERCEYMYQLQLLGLSYREIAKRLAISERTVRRWQKRRTDGTISQPRRKRQSIFDPYAPYVLSRWQQGEHSLDLIWSEIRQQGFKGSKRTLYRFVQSLREGAQELRMVGNNAVGIPLPAESPTNRIAVQKAIWLLVRPYEKLKADERKDLQDLCEVSSDLSTLHTLAQSFGQIVRKREGDRLNDWMSLVKESSFRHIKRFVVGLRRDKEEVLAGLTQVYSNGQVEGFVNKLKLIKRQGYGRASFPLLRQRMLHAL